MAKNFKDLNQEEYVRDDNAAWIVLLIILGAIVLFLIFGWPNISRNIFIRQNFETETNIVKETPAPTQNITATPTATPTQPTASPTHILPTIMY